MNEKISEAQHIEINWVFFRFHEYVVDEKMRNFLNKRNLTILESFWPNHTAEIKKKNLKSKNESKKKNFQLTNN